MNNYDWKSSLLKRVEMQQQLDSYPLKRHVKKIKILGKWFDVRDGLILKPKWNPSIYD